MKMDIPSPILEQVAGGEVTVTEEDDVEEILASGGPPGQLLPQGRSPRGKGVSPAIPRRQSGQLREELPIPEVRSLRFHRARLGDITWLTPGGAERPRKGWNRNSHGWRLDTWRGQSRRNMMTVHGEERPYRE
jgi:hypothetical protein